jgi:gliding motility-associated lipoprotein GldH
MIRTRFLSSGILALITSVWLTGCDSRRVFEENRELSQRYWRYEDAPVFDFQIEDSLSGYNLYFNVRNSLDYPWTRINVTYTLMDSAGQSLAQKLVFHDLFDATGRPYGQSGIGDLYDHQFLLLEKFRFSHPGTYSLRLTQFSREDTLKGVMAVGVRVERAENP